MLVHVRKRLQHNLTYFMLYFSALLLVPDYWYFITTHKLIGLNVYSTDRGNACRSKVLKLYHLWFQFISFFKILFVVFHDTEETNADCNQHPIVIGALKGLFCFLPSSSSFGGASLPRQMGGPRPRVYPFTTLATKLLGSDADCKGLQPASCSVIQNH